MKKTPKILPTYYKSKGTPIFRDTTALPFAEGGPIEDEPGTPPTWNRPQLSAERIAALKALHGDSIFASANPNDLLFYDLNKEAIDNATDFSAFLDPSASVSKSFKEAPTTKDIKTRLGKGWALDTKTGAYFKVPDEIYKEVVFPEPEIVEKMETLIPDPITRKPLGSLIIPERPAFPTYQMPGYMKSYNFPTVGRYTPLAAKAVQKATGYDRNFMEGYYDEEGNYVPGELQNAQEQNRAPQFVGASSLKDMLAQREYLKTLEQTKEYGQGGTIHFERSEYGSDAREHYDDGGKIYTYSKRPGSYYQKTEDGWLINNSSTGGKYVPIEDPTGQRAALLNKYAKPQPGINKIYADPSSRNSETTQAVAAKTTPQTKEQWQTYTAVQQGNQQRRSDIAKALELQGMTPEQAASTVASYGSDWPTLETAKARDIQIMNKTAADIQAGINPSSMQSFTPRPTQPLMDRVQDIAFNPFTAAGYAIRGQAIPDYLQEKADSGTLGYWSNGQFVEGRNALDTAVDIATPIGWAHSASNVIDKATNDKSSDFWTEENAWDALNAMPGLGLLKGAKGLKATQASTGLTQLGNTALDLAQRTRIVPKSTATELAIDAGNLVREPFYAPQRPSLLSPAIAPNNTKALPSFSSQGYPGIMPKYNVAPVEAVGQPNVLAQLGIKEDDKWFPGIKEFKSQVAAKDVSDLPLREAESWLSNWINHPTTQNKMYSSYQEALNSPMKVDNLSKMNVADRVKVKEAYQHNLEEAYKQAASYNPSNRLSYKPISHQILDLPHNEHTGNMGVSYTHGARPNNLLMPTIMNKARNEFDTGKNFISRSISDEDKLLTGVHEGTHDWAKDFALTYLGQKDMFNKYSEPHFSPFLTKWENKLAESELAKDKAGIENAKKSLDYLKYLQEPTELHARIMESRKYFNLTPDDIVTPEKAREMMLLVGAQRTPINYNFGQALLENSTATANMFNKAWMTVPALGGAALLNNNKSENNQQ
jgi:hypothetical protein